MISFIGFMILNGLGAIIVMIIPTFTYLFIKEKVRQEMHRQGYRVYTKEEMVQRNLIPRITNGDIETEDYYEEDYEEEDYEDDDVIEIKKVVNSQTVSDDIDDMLDQYKNLRRKH